MITEKRTMLSTVAQNNILDWSGAPSTGVFEVFWRRNKILLSSSSGPKNPGLFSWQRWRISIYYKSKE